MKYEITENLESKYTKFQLNKLRNHKPIIKRCNLCSSEFDAKSYIFRPTAIYERENEFCSPDCRKMGAGRKNKKVFKDYICVNCNLEFTPHKSKPHQNYCSHKCYTNHLKGSARPEVYKWIHKITPPKNSVSKSETDWVKQFDITHTQYLIKVNNKHYRVDGFNENTNTVYEYLGSFWHGNPEIYNPTDINPVCKRPYGKLYEDTLKRIQTLEGMGYTVVFKWGSR